jgi:hypothetical protein
LVDGHAVVLAHDVPQRHLDRAHAARLPRVVPELLDLPKETIHVQGFSPTRRLLSIRA